MLMLTVLFKMSIYCSRISVTIPRGKVTAFVGMFGGSVYAPVFNGPFAIKANAGFSGNTDKLYEDFMNFPKNYTPSEG